jgi:hypothetical protein
MQAGKEKNGVKLGGRARNRCKFDHDHFLVLIVTTTYLHVGTYM